MLTNNVSEIYSHSRLNVTLLTCRALGLRNDLLPGFDGAVAEFEDWLPLLLLQTPQALEFLRASGDVATTSALEAKISPEYRRFTTEMISILQHAGKSVPLTSQHSIYWISTIILVTCSDIYLAFL